MGSWRPKHVICSTRCPNSRLLSGTGLQSHFANWVRFCFCLFNFFKFWSKWNLMMMIILFYVVYNQVHFCSVGPNYSHHCPNSCPTSQWLPPWLDALKSITTSFFFLFSFLFCNMLPTLCKIVNKHYILLLF